MVRYIKLKLSKWPGFFAVDDRGFTHNVELNRLDPETGMESVRNGLRSVGILDSENPAFRDCKGKW